jgi:cytochrome c2/transcriptional regulator with XRE-family HTH domain
MADRGDTHYSVSAMNAWFLVSSVLLLASFAWMMLDDHARPWKKHQREFRGIEVAAIEAEMAAIEEAGALETEAELLAKVDAARQAVDARAEELAAASEEERLARSELWVAIEAAKKAKSKFNWDRWETEVHRIGEGEPELNAELIAEVELAVNDAVTIQEQKQTLYDVTVAKVEALTAEFDQAEKSLSAGTRDLDRVRKRLEGLAPTDPAVRLANIVRDEIPGLDFVGPNLTVNKVVLDNLTFELNFTKKKRIDMCHTCHVAIDQRGFEDQAEPYATHPRLDLYLTAKSPHPLKDVGCTICHRGSGEALDFVRADHRPSDQAEQTAWEHDPDLHWKKQHHWDYPMLSTGFTEASCVQCHKDSMELIAEDAPTVTEGYRLVEQYGCYSCHKIDWFPTKRRPGPTLTNIQAKTDAEFLASWISDPKAFRPTTWMPQIFHLENYAPDEVVVTSEYGQGRDILGQEWNEASVAAVVAFLQDRAPKKELPGLPVDGDAYRGREVMRLVGCFACHNTAPYGDEQPMTRDLTQERRDTNEHGPNLRGVATKVTEEWLFAWLKDPHALWPETRMPNLRLPDQDAADIVAYMMDDPDGIFTEVPEGWEPKAIGLPEDNMRQVLAELARWYFGRDGRAQLAARLSGEDPEHRWNDTETLKVAVGEKVVGQYGCFSCHEISGMEDMMPIGTELSAWGSKTVDKLDFGFGASLFELDHHYREGWLMQKLHAPRSYDQQKVKNPTEKLRMPYFAFTDDQVQSIATFVVGLVDDEVQRAKMVPDAEAMARDAGMRVVRQKNCMACHMIDPGTITFEGEDGYVHTVQAELTAFEDAPTPTRHDMESVDADMEYYEADEIGMRILRAEPGVGAGVGDKVFIERDQLMGMSAPRGGDFVSVVNDYYFSGIELFDPEADEEDAYYYVTADPDEEYRIEDADGQFRDHSVEPYDKVRWTFAPPVLWNEGAKVKRQWFYGFLRDVIELRPQIRVRMPSFNFADGEAEAVADYFAWKSEREWPSEYTRNLRLAGGLSLEEVAEGAGVKPAIVLAIENGSQPDIRANFAKVLAFGESKEFSMEPAVDPAYEASMLRSHAYLSRRNAEQPGHLQTGENVVIDAVNCFQCHYRLGQPPPADPIAWAPELSTSHERLREDWVLRWLTDPGKVYPGTSMPANFAGDPPQYQDFYPSSNNDEQLRVVMEWLYNFDRVYLGAGGTD